ncbi:MAG: SDR family NAD(P)-dependent oxidoreductase, partial [Eubacterium sp.]|nr:SDR family NAD(P)-dependent oxidoreductase [Eubacterium sp.]
MKKYAVITGASSGIGAAFAKLLSQKGYSLILVARRKERLESLARRLSTDCEAIPADLSKLSECRR